jgi:hypothetical protein
MAVTNFSPLLGLALPTTGDLSGTWGTTVNDSITSLIDSSIAGTTTISSDGDVTLTTTQGSANQARSAVLLCSGARTALRTLTAPAASKAYIIINATTGGFGVKIVGVGPTTGVTVAAGIKALVAWNGSDFVLVSSTDIATMSGTLSTGAGGTGLTTFTSGGAVYATSTSALTTGTLPVASGGTNATSGTAALVSLGERTSATGSIITPVGTTAQRDGTPAAGYLRYNSSTSTFEGYNGSIWGAIGGGGSGATGAGNDKVFMENDLVVASSYTLGSGEQLSCTISIATPGVITQANSYTAGEAVRFTTTGALPTGLSTTAVYYVSATGLSTASFQVSATPGGASITTSGTQSGVQTCGKAKSALTAGPITVYSGATVTVPSGTTWTVV